MKQFQRVGIVGRFKPVHNGHAELLRALCRQSEEVIVGIGSSNRYGVLNPFTAKETRAMLTGALEGYRNYEVIEIPDVDNGALWSENMGALYGKLDVFVSDNEYVRLLLKDRYYLAFPNLFVPPHSVVVTRGTNVRRKMAEDGEWESLVPVSTASYLRENGLVERFQREFGAETLAEVVKK